jgi:hypothetical protein
VLAPVFTCARHTQALIRANEAVYIATDVHADEQPIALRAFADAFHSYTAQVRAMSVRGCGMNIVLVRTFALN